VLGHAVVGDGAREPPLSFTSPPATTTSSSPAQEQTLSAFLFVPGPVTSSYIPVTDANESIHDEWVNLTRNLTLLSARGPATEHDIIINGSREEVMMVRYSEHDSPSS